MTDYTTWTLEELQARFVASGQEFALLANERQAILTEMDMRRDRTAASVRLSSLSDKEKAVLRDLLGVKAESTEAASK